MSVTSLLLPVFVQVALTFGLMFWMAKERRQALLSGQVKPKDISLRQPNWPARATQIANCFHNQLELPMLFYALAAFILVTRTNDIIFVVLAWVFVVARIAHAYVHTGSNEVPKRFASQTVAALALVVMWIIFAVRILSAGA
jgi:hypothetical protein